MRIPRVLGVENGFGHHRVSMLHESGLQHLLDLRKILQARSETTCLHIEFDQRLAKNTTQHPLSETCSALDHP